MKSGDRESKTPVAAEEPTGRYRFSINVETRIVDEVLSGDVCYELFSRMIIEMFQHPDFCHAQYLLCDYRAVDRINLNDRELESIEDNIRQLQAYCPGAKIAIVVDDNRKIHPTMSRFIERVVETGIVLKVDDDIDGSRGWLLTS